MSKTNATTLLSVIFSMADAFHGTLSLRFNNDKQLHLVIIHKCPDGQIRSYDLDGDDGIAGIEVCDADAIVVLAHRSGEIVACGVFEVDLALTDVGALLIPRALNNLVLDQEEGRYTAPLVTQQEVVVA